MDRTGCDGSGGVWMGLGCDTVCGPVWMEDGAVCGAVTEGEKRGGYRWGDRLPPCFFFRDAMSETAAEIY